MSGSCCERKPPEERGRKGYALIFGALMLFLILVPSAGLAVDVGMMYLTQSQLSAASDGAALAGARALSRGTDDATQRANAEATANSYLHANFPSGYLWSTNLQVNSVAATDSQYLRSVTTTASVDLPLVFLRIFRSTSTAVSTHSKATRRDANIMIVMDRSGSLQTSGACAPLKAAAVNFVDKFAEGRDNLGLITFATSVRVESPLSTTFKTSVESTLNAVTCRDNTNTSHAIWQGYKEMVALNQPGALNAMVVFTDGLPTAISEDFPIKVNPNTCLPKPALGLTGVLTDGPNGLYDLTSLTPTVIAGTSHCAFPAVTDLQYAPLTDHWGNSLTATSYKSVTYSGAGLKVSSSSNVDNFSTNATDHAALRVRRGDPDPLQANRSLPGVVIFTIGLGAGVDTVLLKRMANDPSLTPNPVAAGAAGKYEFAGDASQLNDAFTRVASEVLRLAQ